MKLNPPETAPKDGCQFLAVFGSDAILPRLASWVGERTGGLPVHCSGHLDMHGHWAAVVSTSSGFITMYWKEENLHGWLPMPKIDEEGNVT